MAYAHFPSLMNGKIPTSALPSDVSLWKQSAGLRLRPGGDNRPVGRIPFNQLPKFDLCEQEMYEEGALNGLTTIYDLLRASGKNGFSWNSASVTVDAVVERSVLKLTIR